jgi:alpha-aminoadipic semialdehyde synthase
VRYWLICGIAKDASTYFSSKILPYVRYLVSSPERGAIGDTIQRAIIVKDGQLEETHKGLMPSVQAYRATAVTVPGAENSSINGTLADGCTAIRRSGIVQRSVKKRVLLLGSGLVAGPAVQVISARKDIDLGIGEYRFREICP